jgi:asparagine synthase (glutamine-hydrolysing)
MDGIFGWLGDHAAHHELIKSMGCAMRLSPESLLHEHSNSMLGIAGCSRFGKAAIHVEDGLVAAVHGRPKFHDDALAATARDRGPAAATASGWTRFGAKLPTLLSGTFALAVIEPLRKRAFLAIDRMGVERLCYARRNGQLVFGTRARSVAAHPAIGGSVDLQAIYDYLYFHAIPSPRTLYHGIEKLQPGQCLSVDNGEARVDFYWHADYTAEPGRDFGSYRGTFRELLREVVGGADEPRVATFLSGGTDSSTVVGSLTEVRGGPVDTFSIGFDAAGFDEMEYARCAVERFRSRPHEIYVKPEDIVTAIPIIAREYDEPFGNASAVPTYFCAKAAREAGFERMLAGDGGDEIFGGNTRCRKKCSRRISPPARCAD